MQVSLLGQAETKASDAQACKTESRVTVTVEEVNQVWEADFSFLTRRFAYTNRPRNRYEDVKPMKHGSYHERGLKRNPTFYPKWSRYAFRGLDKHRPVKSIPIYSRPVLLFAIEDAYSRYIIHACLRRSPKDYVNKSFAFPGWFKLGGCFEEAFDHRKRFRKTGDRLVDFGRPISFYLDSNVYLWYRDILEDKALFLVRVGPGNHNLLGRLDGFFGRIQYEMRTNLTQRNLDAYVFYYNFVRKHSGIGGQTPASLFFKKSSLAIRELVQGKRVGVQNPWILTDGRRQVPN